MPLKHITNKSNNPNTTHILIKKYEIHYNCYSCYST